MNLVFTWRISQIGGIGTVTGAAGSMKRILTQVDNAGGDIWIDDAIVTVAEAEAQLGTAWESSAENKLIIVGDESGTDPYLEQSIIIQYVG